MSKIKLKLCQDSKEGVIPLSAEEKEALVEELKAVVKKAMQYQEAEYDCDRWNKFIRLI